MLTIQPNLLNKRRSIILTKISIHLHLLKKVQTRCHLIDLILLRHLFRLQPRCSINQISRPINQVKLKSVNQENFKWPKKCSVWIQTSVLIILDISIKVILSQVDKARIFEIKLKKKDKKYFST